MNDLLSRLHSRKFLLALITQIVGIGVLLFPEHQSVISQWATNLGAMLMMALTAVGYIHGEAKVDAEANRNAAALAATKLNLEHKQRELAIRAAQASTIPHNSPAAPPAAKAANVSAPPRVATILMLATSLVGAAALGGCATSPETRWYQAQDTLNTTRNAIVAQWKAGNVSNADFVAMDAVEKAVRSSLKQAKAELDSLPDETQPPQLGGFEQWMGLAEGALDKLIDILRAKEQAHGDRRDSGPGDSGPGDAGHGNAGDGLLGPADPSA